MLELDSHIRTVMMVNGQDFLSFRTMAPTVIVLAPLRITEMTKIIGNQLNEKLWLI